MIPALFSRQSLTTKIALGTLVTFLAGTLSISFIAVGMLRDDLQRVLGAHQFSTVSLLASQVNVEIDDRLKALEAAANYVSPLMAGDPRVLQSHLNSYPEIQRLFNGTVLVTGTDGTAIADVPRLQGRVGTSYMDRDVIVAALREGKTTIGKPVIGKVLRAPLLTMGTPVRDGKGQVIGALLGAIDLAKPNFLDRIAENKYGETGSFYIVDRRFRLIVTSSDKSRIMETQPAPGVNPTIDLAIQGDVLAAIYTNPKGVEVLGSVKGIPVANWYVGLIVPTEEAFASVRAIQQRLLLGTLIFSLAACALVWWLTRRVLSRQFAPMIEATRALDHLSGAGQPPRSLPIANDDEVGELIGGFNRMLGSLEERDAALSQSEGRSRAIIEASPVALALNDEDGNITTLNPAFVEAVGYTLNDIPTLAAWWPRAYPDPQYRQWVGEQWQKNLDQAKRSGNPFVPVEVNIHCKDDSVRTFLASAAALEDRFAGSHLVILYDITERKSAEVQVRKLSLAVEQSPESIVITNLNAEIEYVNEAFVRNTGYSRAEVTGRNPRILQSGKTPVETISALWDALTHGRSWDGEFSNRRKDGSEYTEHAVITPIRQPDGTITHYVAVKEDITERRRLEEALRQHKEELQGLARSVLEVREEDRRKVARELHDDLGHRVTSLSMDLGRLESKLLASESEAKAMLPAIFDQVYQFADATRRICEDLRPGMLDTLGLPAAVQGLVASFTARTSIPCELVMSHNDFAVDARVGIHLFRILQEALNNAMKHAKASNILVTLQFSEQEISLIVEDDGIGLPEQGQQRRIGFGLLGMRERVATLNGQLSISSKPGRGARIEAVIPT